MRERGTHRTGGWLVGLAAIAGTLLAREAYADEVGPGPQLHVLSAGANQNARREAQRRFERGNRALQDNHFDDAYEQFEQAYLLWPRTTFVLAMANAQMRLGNHAKARALYELCLAGSDEGLDLRQRLVELDATAALEGSESPQRPPLPSPAPLPDVAPPPGLLAEIPAAPDMPDTPLPWYRRWWVWTAGAVALAGAGAAIAVSLSRPGYVDRGSLGYLGVPDR